MRLHPNTQLLDILLIIVCLQTEYRYIPVAALRLDSFQLKIIFDLSFQNAVDYTINIPGR